MTADRNVVNGAEVISNNPSTTSTPERPRLTLQSASFGASSQNLIHSASQIPTPTEEYDPNSTHPFSPFYSHPTTRTSFEQHKSESKVNIKIYEKDLEAGTPRVRQSVEPSRSNVDCTIWPGTHQLLEKSIATKKSRSYSPFRALSRKQKLCVKLFIAFIIVGAAVGIGIGVSKAVGSGVWKSINSQSQIGGSGS